MTTQSRSYGKATLRWQPSKDGGYSGVVISGGKRGGILHDDDEGRLIRRLQNEAGKLEPGYVGMDEAIARFLEFMPGGLRGERSVSDEQEYKRAASRELNAVLPIEAALEADRSGADKLRSARVWLNILSPFESMHMKQVLENAEGPAFLRSAARFASGDFAAGARGMEEALKKYGRQSWPKATYLGYLWDPSSNMFCKPQVTTDFAQRIGHEFCHVYESEINERVYCSLKELADLTLAATRSQAVEARYEAGFFVSNSCI